MASGPVRVGGVAPGSIAGAAEFQALLRSYPQGVIDDTRAELERGAEQLVAAIQERAPVSDLEAHPGELRDSVHKEDGRHDLSVVVIEDAKDKDGHAYPGHVEYGHKAKDGRHVAAIPHFWPAVRDGRRKIISGIAAGMRRRAKAGS